MMQDNEFLRPSPLKFCSQFFFLMSHLKDNSNYYSANIYCWFFILFTVLLNWPQRKKFKGSLQVPTETHKGWMKKCTHSFWVNSVHFSKNNTNVRTRLISTVTSIKEYILITKYHNWKSIPPERKKSLPLIGFWFYESPKIWFKTHTDIVSSSLLWP